MKLKDKTLVITGGGSGIGKIIGRLALERGAKMLIIWDINPTNIDSTIADLTPLAAGRGAKLAGIRVDVSNQESLDAAYNETMALTAGVDVLINCAGIIANNRTFDQQTPADIVRTMNINATAPMLVALKFLPEMISRNSGHICTIASAAGMLAMPKMSVYVASKWAAYGWSDSVKLELKLMGSKVRVTTVAPYFIDTGMFQGIRSRIFPLLDPEHTSRKIINAVERNKDRRGIPFSFHFIRFMQGIFPSGLFDLVFGKIVGLYSVMDHFTGRRPATEVKEK